MHPLTSRPLALAVAAALAALAAACAAAPLGSPQIRPANPPVAAASPGQMGKVVGGSVASACQLDDTVLLESAEGVCSGTLVHPSIVIYAAHCGDTMSTIFFGEHVLTVNADNTVSVAQPTRRIDLPAGSCHLIPGHQNTGPDYAYCKLPTPVTDVPIVPILMGCETQILAQPTPVLVAGFGQNGMGTYGTKKWGQTTAQMGANNMVELSSQGATLCFGDSGGPAFVQLPTTATGALAGDGTWRVFGVANSIQSTDGTCMSAGQTGLMSAAVPWVESDSGIDITPCTDAMGNWAPTAACGHFPTDLTAVSGDGVAQACLVTQNATAMSATCGAAFAPSGPTVTLLSPTDGESVVAGSQSEVRATVSLSGGQIPQGISVGATLDGQALAPLTDAQPPTYAFGPVSWAAGTHKVVVTVIPATGASAEATATVEVAAGGGGAAAAPAPAAGPAAVAFSQENVAARGCAAASPMPPAAALTGLAALAARRRRQRRLSCGGQARHLKIKG